MHINEDKKEKIIQKLSQVIANSPISIDLIHAQKTVKWLKVLKPDADDALQIAAFGHDIERGVNQASDTETKVKDYNKYKANHSQESSKNIRKILSEIGCDEDFVSKVALLVLRHEVGGDQESDILRDADSIAYFDYNIPFYLEHNGVEKTKYKIRFMSDRITSPEARELIANMDLEPKIKALVNEALNLYNNCRKNMKTLIIYDSYKNKGQK